MATPLRVVIWNANGLSNHKLELQTFLDMHKIDIALISETHFTSRTVFKLPHYTVYHTIHPDDTAHGGAAVILRSSIRHHELLHHQSDKIQTASIQLDAHPWPLTISAIYCPPRHAISVEEYSTLFRSLGSRFLIGGDWNAKHTAWGARLITPKGRNLFKALSSYNCQYFSTGGPTYWPTDLTKLPDLLDFLVARGIPATSIQIESVLELSSDHSPVVATIGASATNKAAFPTLATAHTNWDMFRAYINERINLRLRIKERAELDEATQYFTTLLQAAAWHSTPPSFAKSKPVNNTPLHIRELIAEKRRSRGRWQRSRNQGDRLIYNRLKRKLQTALRNANNSTFEHYLTSLSPSDNTLWKATKRLKRPQVSIPPIRKADRSWAKSDDEKAIAFADHLQQVFSPHLLPIPTDAAISAFLDVPCQMSLPIKPFSPNEVVDALAHINVRKAPGYDLISGKVLKELPKKAILLLTILYNSILRLSYYPLLWKFAQIVMVPKPGKPTEDAASYRPISLLPIPSKVFEKLLLRRLRRDVDLSALIPDYQFGFRAGHSTIHQTQRIVHEIAKGFEGRKLCTAVFLDVAQAFDKVWHTGLLYKLKSALPSSYYLLLKTYLHSRYFQVKYNNSYSACHEVLSGVPQGSVLGPLLYLLFTADLPTTNHTTIATFADDTGLLAVHSDPIVASQHLQHHLNILQAWFDTWKIKVNQAKSAHVTFTTLRTLCPPVAMNNVLIPVQTDVKYLGLHLDQRLTWRTHIRTKRRHLNLKLRGMYWLLGRRSKLSLANKLLLYKCVIKPVWTYGIQLWGCAKPSHTQIIQRLQSKILRSITNAPWYVSNFTLHNDLHIPFVTTEINRLSHLYHQRLEGHHNALIAAMTTPPTIVRRLQRQWPTDLFRSVAGD